MTAKQWAEHTGLSLGILLLANACMGDGMHQGRLPFRLLESSPNAKAPIKVLMKGMPRGLELVASFEGDAVPPELLERIEPGDLVAFYMSHRDAIESLWSRGIQKIPYELLRYGHLALVVPDPHGSEEVKLLQVAMKQAVQADHGMEYLAGKSWHLFRPPVGFVDVSRLGEFTRIVCERAADSESAYDYPGVLGWKNAPWQPEELEEIGHCFSCTTLVVAALHYAGYELDAVHRGGRLDIVTPRQVVDSRGWKR